ncbi:MAG: hypothetical protein R3F14_33920 [Polyangiaceae bacterium]
MSGLDIHYPLGEGHPLLGRRIPDLDLENPHRPSTRIPPPQSPPSLLHLGPHRHQTSLPWSDRVQRESTSATGVWDPPVLGPVPRPPHFRVLIRPDGHVAQSDKAPPPASRKPLTRWFGPPAR